MTAVNLTLVDFWRLQYLCTCISILFITCRWLSGPDKTSHKCIQSSKTYHPYTIRYELCPSPTFFPTVTNKFYTYLPRNSFEIIRLIDKVLKMIQILYCNVFSDSHHGWQRNIYTSGSTFQSKSKWKLHLEAEISIETNSQRLFCESRQ